LVVLILVLAAVTGEPPVRAHRLLVPVDPPAVPVYQVVCPTPASGPGTASTAVAVEPRPGQILVWCGNG
jgi:hypothetical protein